MPAESLVTLPLKPVPLVSKYRNAYELAWKDALVKEGFGRENIYEMRAQNTVDVSDEIDSLMYYLKLQAFYETSDDFVDMRKAFLAEYASPYFSYNTLQRSVLPTTSFVSDTIDRIALLYKQPALREYNGAQNDALQMLYREAGMNRVAKTRHRRLILHNLIATRPLVRMRNGSPVFTYDVLTPDQFRCLVDEQGNVTKFLYGGYREVDGKTAYVIYVWTATEHYYISGGKRYAIEGGDGTNPYGRIPYHITQLDPGQELFSGGMHSLVESNIYVNYLRLLENTNGTFSTTSVFLGVNMNIGDDPVISPRSVFAVENVEETAGIIPPSGQYISSTPQAQLLRDLADAEEMRAKMSVGLSPAMLKETISEMSGRALEQMYRPLLDIRDDHIEIMRDDEAELFELTCHIANIERAMGNYPQLTTELPTDSKEFRIDFADITFDDMTPDAKYDLMMRQAKDGTRNITDVFMMINPDIDTPEEAEKQMRKNAALARDLTRAGFGVSFLDSVMSQPEPDANADTANQIGA